MTATLPKLKVRTAHSEYLIDQNAGTFARTRVHDDATRLATFGLSADAGEAVAYDKIVSPLEEGTSLVITLPDGSWVRSTAIQSVEEVA